MNLAALPETIVESELFGHERGAFTGAVAKREGRIAQARGGTLFLDEIGELSPQVQVKLLRVLQEGEYEPLGGRTEQAEFRLIAATNRDLRAAVDAGEFREDLYYRLNVIAVTSPPLRDRRDDIPLLVDHFLDVYGRKNGKAGLSFDRHALEQMTAYDWGGNVRELENVVERAVVLGKGAVIGVDDLPEHVAKAEPSGDTLAVRHRDPAERDRAAGDPRDAPPHLGGQAARGAIAGDLRADDLPQARRRARGERSPAPLMALVGDILSAAPS